jgi:hypothetical protein
MQEVKEKHVFALCIFCKDFSHTTGRFMELTYTTPPHTCPINGKYAVLPLRVLNIY